MVSGTTSLAGIKVRLPAPSDPTESIDDSDDTVQYTSPYIPPSCEYNPAHDIFACIAIINGNITEAASVYKFRMWLLSQPVINGMIPASSDFPAEKLTLLHEYITARYDGFSGINYVFRNSLWFLSCCCTNEIRNGVLQWMQDYLTSHTPVTSCCTPAQESSSSTS